MAFPHFTCSSHSSPPFLLYWHLGAQDLELYTQREMSAFIRGLTPQHVKYLAFFPFPHTSHYSPQKPLDLVAGVGCCELSYNTQLVVF